MNRLLVIFGLLCFTSGAFGQDYAKDTTGRKIFTWQLTDYFSRVDSATLDTSLLGFQIYNPNFKLNIFPAYLGNLGSAGFSNNFLLRKKANPFFLQNFQQYFNTPENQVYVNTKVPFTDFSYSTGGGRAKSEQTVRLIHTRNITPDLNVGLKVNVYSSDGQYAYQKCNDNTVLAFMSYTKNRYKVYLHASMNKVAQDENGGLLNEADLEGALTEDVPTRLDVFNKAQTRMKNMNLQLVQQLSVGKFKFLETGDSLKDIESAKNTHDWARVIHVFKYTSNHKLYKDENPGTGFYSNIWIDSLNTYDSIYYREISNSLSLDFQSNPERKFRMALNLGVLNEINRYSYNIPEQQIIHSDPIDIFSLSGIELYVFNNDTTYLNRKNENLINTAVRGELINDLGALAGWKASGRFYFQGYKAGNLLLQGHLYKKFTTRKGPAKFTLGGLVRNERPRYWMNHFASNNFKWQHNFSFENETSVRAGYSQPGRSFHLSGGVSLLGNYVYFDTLALPAQAVDPFLVLSASLNKDFYLWKIRFRNYLSIQQSGNQDVLPLPLLSFRNSTYFDHNLYFPWTKGNLYVHLGFDLYIHTLYYASAYMPATAMFYQQSERMIGNYPYLDAFLNLKVKRTRIFFKYEHVTSGFMGYDFFTVLHYPMNQRVFKVGFSWTFYD